MTRFLSVLLVTGLCLALAVPADSYDTQLDSQAVREAYFLGRRGDQKTSEFLEAYIKHLAIPKHGPYIADISLYTPYAQVVFDSWRNSVGYSAQQAAEHYRASKDVIPVSVRILFTPTYLAAQSVQPSKDSATQQVYALRRDGFWRDFQFELHQEKETIKPRSVKGTPIYDDGGYLGAVVDLEYDARELKSEETAFEVVTPDGQQVIAEFNLSTLR
jgi:hypothetical protein